MCQSAPIEFQAESEVLGIPVFKYGLPPQALHGNYSDGLGYCAQYHPEVDFDACAKETDNPDVLDMTACPKDPEGRPICPDGNIFFRNLAFIMAPRIKLKVLEIWKAALELPFGSPSPTSWARSTPSPGEA